MLLISKMGQNQRLTAQIPEGKTAFTQILQIYMRSECHTNELFPKINQK